MNLDHVRQLTFAPILQRYDIRDSALYALSLGIGADPLDEDELPYVYEGRGPLAVPSQCVTLCWPPFWHKEPETGISWRRILHGEQSFSLLRPLAVKGAVRAEHSILAVDDKGAERGVIVYTAHDLFDELIGEPLAHLRSAEFLRDDGGCGGFGAAPKLTRPLKDAAEPTAFCDFRTSRQPRLHADSRRPRYRPGGRVRSPDLAWPQHFRPRLPGGPQALRAAKAGGDRLDGCALRVARVPRRHHPD
jgi:hypothetical protein